MKKPLSKNKIVYHCLGTCGALISEKRYQKGLHKCGAKTCTHYGVALTKMEIDKKGHLYPAEEKHKDK